MSKPPKSSTPAYLQPCTCGAVHPTIHGLFYGDPGAKKSSLAASFACLGPMLVLSFDPLGKDAPYGRIPGITRTTKGQTEEGLPFRRYYAGDRLLIQLEYYHDLDPAKPDAMALYRVRAGRLASEINSWATVVLDSLTSMSAAAYLEQRFVVNSAGANPSAEDVEKRSLRWRAGQTDSVEHYAAFVLPNYPSNVIVIAHSAEEKVQVVGANAGRKTGKIEMHNEMIRGLAAPGRLARAGGLAGRYAEIYHLYATREGNVTSWVVQTEPDDDWVAASQINAPNLCEPDYHALWGVKMKKGKVL